MIIPSALRTTVWDPEKAKPQGLTYLDVFGHNTIPYMMPSPEQYWEPCLLLFRHTGYNWQQVIDWHYLTQRHFLSITSAIIEGVNKSPFLFNQMFDQAIRNEPHIL